jgi:hypothetical protein
LDSVTSLLVAFVALTSAPTTADWLGHSRSQGASTSPADRVAPSWVLLETAASLAVSAKQKHCLYRRIRAGNVGLFVLS